jgi:hypothetical protein
MAKLTDQIVALAEKHPGMTDREITSHLRGASPQQQPINQTARHLVSQGRLKRERRRDGLIGNYPLSEPENPRKSPTPGEPSAAKPPTETEGGLSEDQCKEALAEWLQRAGWHVEMAMGHERGIDIEAKRHGGQRWIIEVKGPGSRQPMRVNYFLAILGETLQRMDDPAARYSIAFPDRRQYRGLWERLPALAKRRTGITLLLVAEDGSIEHKSV